MGERPGARRALRHAVSRVPAEPVLSVTRALAVSAILSGAAGAATVHPVVHGAGSSTAVVDVPPANVVPAGASALGRGAAGARDDAADDGADDRRSPPEQALLGALEAWRAGDQGTARDAGRALLEAVPDFQLARVLLRDLEAIARGGSPTFEWFARAPATAHPPFEEDADAALAAEAAQRWTHRDFRAGERRPASLLRVSPRYRHVIVVEADTSRLYLFRNGDDGLRLLADHYVSIGREGAGKEREGDLRTPLGVYFTLSRMDSETLAAKYGSHAFPLSYPNYWDRRQQRTGRGIWIHGVPEDTYTRPPRDSEGCVAMANEDIRRMGRTIDPRFTPVVITRRVDWVDGTDPASPAAAVAGRVRAWHAARMVEAPGDAGALQAFYQSPADPRRRYSAARAGGGEGLPAPAQTGLGRADPFSGRSLEHLSIFAYPGELDMVLVVFDEQLPSPSADGKPRMGWRRQYWRHQGGEWRIVVERRGSYRPGRP